MRKNIGVFRGKRKDNGKWIEGFFTCATDCCGRSYFIDVPRKDPDDSNHRYEVVLETVGEYTGVDDIDGVRIFEGDIVKNIVTDLICAVARDNYYAGFVINKDSKTQFSLSKASGRAHQVIGNIHDNPELLGGAK